MKKPTIRIQAPLPVRRSYKVGRTPTSCARSSRRRMEVHPPFSPHPACAPEGAWLPESPS
jgi:hypothetical protein